MVSEAEVCAGDGADTGIEDFFSSEEVTEKSALEEAIFSLFF
jgi:hypothetical protein